MRSGVRATGHAHLRRRGTLTCDRSANDGRSRVGYGQANFMMPSWHITNNLPVVQRQSYRQAFQYSNPLGSCVYGCERKLFPGHKSIAAPNQHNDFSHEHKDHTSQILDIIILILLSYDTKLKVRYVPPL